MTDHYLGIDAHKRQAQVAVFGDEGEVTEEVRVLDANLFDDLTSFVYYCYLCVPFVDIDTEVYGLFTRDASA